MKKNQSKRVFVVEDDLFYQQAVVNELIEMQYGEVEAFSTGEACIDNLYKMPDIVLLDYQLGDITGIKVLRKIKSLNPDIQVIMLSGQDSLDVAVKSLKYGAYDYVVKSETAFERIKQTLNRIEKLQELMEDSKKSRRNKAIFVTAISVLWIAVIAGSYLYPELFN